MKRTTLCYIENKNDDSFLMLYRNKKKNDDNAGKWLGIGGKFEPGESSDDCNVREVREETGLRLASYHFYGVVKFRSDAYEYEDMYLYSSDDWIPEDERMADEFRRTGTFTPPQCSEGELHWIRKDELASLPMWEGDTVFLERVLRGDESINLTMIYEGDHLAEVIED